MVRGLNIEIRRIWVVGLLLKYLKLEVFLKLFEKMLCNVLLFKE